MARAVAPEARTLIQSSDPAIDVIVQTALGDNAVQTEQQMNGEQATTTETAEPELPSSYLDDDTTSHTPEQQRLIDEFKAAVDQRIIDFVNRVRSLQNPRYRSKVSTTVSEVGAEQAQKVQELTGLDVSGYKNTIDGDAIDHIDRRHGANGEANRSMADINDYGRIGCVLDNFDTAELITSSDGTPETSRKWRNSDGTRAHMIQF